jgi:hypothetical protein
MCKLIRNKEIIKRIGIIAGVAGVIAFSIVCATAILEALQDSHNVIDVVGVTIGGLLVIGYVIIQFRSYMDRYPHSIRVSSVGTNNYTKQNRLILQFLLHIVNKIKKLW